MKSNRFRIALVTLLLAALLLPTLAFATTAYVATQTSGLNLRQGPGTGYSVVRSFPRGTQVEIYATQGAWAYVSVGGYTGYSRATGRGFRPLTATTPMATTSRPFTSRPGRNILTGLPRSKRRTTITTPTITPIINCCSMQKAETPQRVSALFFIPSPRRSSRP